MSEARLTLLASLASLVSLVLVAWLAVNQGLGPAVAPPAPEGSAERSCAPDVTRIDQGRFVWLYRSPGVGATGLPELCLEITFDKGIRLERRVPPTVRHARSTAVVTILPAVPGG